MFEELQRLPDDPILGLMRLYREDPSPDKLDLGAGVYQDERGATPVLRAVKEAERRVYEAQRTKAYEGLAGNAAFNRAMQATLFGADHPALRDGRLATVQTTGGSGGLHIAAHLVRRVRGDAVIWVSHPTWPNHEPLLGAAGVRLKTYPYFDERRNGLDFDAMAAAMDELAEGSTVLLHGCCHNPTGVDLTRDQWDALVAIFERRHLIPFIDVAYQGFAEGIDEDAYGVRRCAERLPETIVVVSCSKNFGLYRDRVGIASVVARNSESAGVAATHLANITRTVYSMPPAHGAEAVATILDDPALAALWREELDGMRGRLNGLRTQLAAALSERTGSERFSFVARQRGMFSLLGLNRAQIDRLREEFHIYIVGSSRANIAGVTETRLDYLSDAIAAVL